jgi:hypothetical protein
MARFTVILPDSVAEWTKKSAVQEGISQIAFVSNMLSFAMASIGRDIRIMDLEDDDEKWYAAYKKERELRKELEAELKKAEAALPLQ